MKILSTSTLFALFLGAIVLPDIGKVYAVPIVPLVNKTNNDAFIPHPFNENHHPLKSIECDACSYIANGVNQTLFHNPKVVAFVTTDIQKICSVLPASVQSECNDAAESVAPLILAQLGNFVADEGCQDLGICRSNTNHVFTIAH